MTVRWIVFGVGVGALTIGLLFGALWSLRKGVAIGVTAAVLLGVGITGTGAAMTTGAGLSGPEPSPSPTGPQLEVTGKDFSFGPSTLHLKAGRSVLVRFRNDGPSFHTFTASELGLDLRANPGQAVKGTLRIAKPGTYPFECTVPGHAQLGMRGTIMVT